MITPIGFKFMANNTELPAKQYGIARMGGLSFSDDPDTIRLKDFQFRINERFLYEYDFTDDWQHAIRVKALLDPDPRQKYPKCINTEGDEYQRKEA